MQHVDYEPTMLIDDPVVPELLPPSPPASLFTFTPQETSILAEAEPSFDRTLKSVNQPLNKTQEKRHLPTSIQPSAEAAEGTKEFTPLMPSITTHLGVLSEPQGPAPQIENPFKTGNEPLEEVEPFTSDKTSAQPNTPNVTKSLVPIMPPATIQPELLMKPQKVQPPPDRILGGSEILLKRTRTAVPDQPSADTNPLKTIGLTATTPPTTVPQKATIDPPATMSALSHPLATPNHRSVTPPVLPHPTHQPSTPTPPSSLEGPVTNAGSSTGKSAVKKVPDTGKSGTTAEHQSPEYTPKKKAKKEINEFTTQEIQGLLKTSKEDFDKMKRPEIELIARRLGVHWPGANKRAQIERILKWQVSVRAKRQEPSTYIEGNSMFGGARSIVPGRVPGLTGMQTGVRRVVGETFDRIVLPGMDEEERKQYRKELKEQNQERLQVVEERWNQHKAEEVGRDMSNKSIEKRKPLGEQEKERIADQEVGRETGSAAEKEKVAEKKRMRDEEAEEHEQNALKEQKKRKTESKKKHSATEETKTAEADESENEAHAEEEKPLPEQNGVEKDAALRNQMSVKERKKKALADQRKALEEQVKALREQERALEETVDDVEMSDVA